MRCHYEVLGVSRDANGDDLKKAYRKLVLQHHPDKNPDRIDESTELFRTVQQAYEVLSDPQERAFYDKHREAILRGGENFVDNELDLMKYFDASVYSGFHSGPDGFYAVYSWVFKKLYEEDEPYREEEEISVCPDFGTVDTEYEDGVRDFYNYWQNYCTLKSYVWHEKYDIRQAANRPTLRLMEKENKKLRDAARRNRNEEVRALAAFVKKRDRRVRAYIKQLEEKEKILKEASEKKRIAQIKENQRLLEDYEEQEWMSFANMQRELHEIEAHFIDDSPEDSDTLDDIQKFYCIACEKSFKSEKALTNHEKSKKHKENVDLIKQEMENHLITAVNTEANANLVEEAASGGMNAENPSGLEFKSELQDDITEVVFEESGGKETEQHGMRRQYHHLDSVSLPSNYVNLEVKRHSRGDDMALDIAKWSDSLSGEENQNVNYGSGSDDHQSSVDSEPEIDPVTEGIEDSVDVERMVNFMAGGVNARLGKSAQDSLQLPRKASSKKKLKEKRENFKRVGSVDSQDNDEECTATLESHADRFKTAHLGQSSLSDSMKINKKKIAQHAKKKKHLRKISESSSGDEESRKLQGDLCQDTSESEGHLTAKEAPVGETTGSKEKEDKKMQGIESKCNVCSEVFPSRTKLFDHIRAQGHALKVEQTVGNEKAKKKKKGGK